MKANVKGFDVEGTPEEVARLIESVQAQKEFLREKPMSLATMRPTVISMPKSTVSNVPVPTIPIKKKMVLVKRKWSKEQDDFIKEHMGNMTVVEIAKHLGRSLKSVWVRRSLARRGFKLYPSQMVSRNVTKGRRTTRRFRRWTPEEDELIKKEVASLGKNPTWKQVTKMQRRLVKRLKRSKGAVMMRRMTLGLTFFSKQSSKSLKEPKETSFQFPDLKYATVDKKIVRQVLEQVARSKGALQYKDATYVLGIASIGLWRSFLHEVLLHGEEILGALGLSSHHGHFKVENDVLKFGGW